MTSYCVSYASVVTSAREQMAAVKRHSRHDNVFIHSHRRTFNKCLQHMTSTPQNITLRSMQNAGFLCTEHFHKPPQINSTDQSQCT